MARLRIAFTGAESTGKTTLVNALKEHFPTLTVVTGLTSKVPNYLDKSRDVQKDILVVYTNTLLETWGTGFLCDRTIFDVCAYSKVKGVWRDDYIHNILKAYTPSPIFPDYVFYLPIEFDFIQDGRRPEGTREQVDAAIKGYIDEYCPDYITLTGSVDERVAAVLKEIKQ